MRRRAGPAPAPRPAAVAPDRERVALGQLFGGKLREQMGMKSENKRSISSDSANQTVGFFRPSTSTPASIPPPHLTYRPVQSDGASPGCCVCTDGLRAVPHFQHASNESLCLSLQIVHVHIGNRLNTTKAHECAPLCGFVRCGIEPIESTQARLAESSSPRSPRYHSHRPVLEPGQSGWRRVPLVRRQGRSAWWWRAQSPAAALTPPLAH